jgi:hypothetical protein
LPETSFALQSIPRATPSSVDELPSCSWPSRSSFSLVGLGILLSDFFLRNVVATNAVKVPVPVALAAMIAAVAKQTGHIFPPELGR